MGKFFPADRLMHTGNPVRTQIVGSNISRAEGLAFFGLDAGHTSVLITGGSLGAKSINEAIDAGIPLLIKNKIQLIWQTGKTFAAKAAEHAAESRLIWSNQFISKMEYMHMQRRTSWFPGRAVHLYELCVVKKPVIFLFLIRMPRKIIRPSMP